ncbi:MAG: glutamate synthase large subunit [Rhodospirillales bacterium]|nr:glutamate synthase large subunit [Rhodospirillales bacterium]
MTAQDLRNRIVDARRLDRDGMYDPAFEHDACGVGLVAALDGRPRREVVVAGVDALKAVWHRGAVDADGKTGDGAGIQVQIPQDFFKKHVERTGHEPDRGRLAVGMIFLPKTDLGAAEVCRAIVESEILNFGYRIFGWRQVPIDSSIIGEKANATRPEIEQIMIADERSADERFECDLYIIRRKIEARVREAQVADFFICSLSCRSIVYKGMFLAEQLSAFYPDLLDERFVSSFAIFHQRYSTNTFPTWKLAQPFRMLAHNGEINTVRGNTNWMKSHEARIDHDAFADHLDVIKPVIPSGSSDSAALDAVFELLVQGNRSVPLVKCMLIPEAWGGNADLSEEVRALYLYCNTVMEPWDGPAAIAASDGRWVLAGMDRNGLRPMRYSETRDGLLFVGSETGMVPLSEQNLRHSGRLGPGEMIAVDLAEGRLYKDVEIKEMLAAEQPYSNWVGNITHLDDLVEANDGADRMFELAALKTAQRAASYSIEDLELILQPMVEEAKEAIGSMGDDTPLAVLSNHYRGLHHFFRQNFSQVTNPPIDSLRERRVMTLATRLGNLSNILDQDESQTRILQLQSPVLTNAQYAAMRRYLGTSATEIDCTYAASGAGPDALNEAITRVRCETEDAVRGGCEHIILTDESQGRGRVAIPMILAVGAVHSHLVRQSLRTFISLHARTAECLDVHFFAVLVGVGATAINAYLAEESIAERHHKGLFGDRPLTECVARYKKAVDDGLLKIMSKMGISVISSYRGGYNFETIGLSRTLVAEFFPGMPSRISGIGLTGIQRRSLSLHAEAFAKEVIALPIGGIYRYRRGGESHAYEAGLIHTLQTAVATDSYQLYKRYAQGMDRRPPFDLRDLLDFTPRHEPVGIDEVESITEIRKRFVTPGMSMGALSPEAHETLTIAMNRIGALSDSGEGGEDPERFQPRPNGDNPNSPIKQVASGRFGVTAQYLTNCRELEIKIAQGAKPGEGGQLPGFKVTEMIAKLRHATPGVMLISPPPHHDIYSIEDLAQLIYDLKQINPTARVCVKLVSQAGVGTVAAGVAKAKADVILISGHVGGTGASPQTSIKFAGSPWEMGLAEANQVLTLNRLRHTVRLRTDGGIRTGRDVVIAAMMGAEEFGVGTASLVAMGCILVRQCHSNTCPVGICTQKDSLRAKFDGTPEKVVNLFSFIAEEVREILASLGVRSLNEIIGRTDLLTQISRGSDDLDDLDLNPLLVQADSGDAPRYCITEGRNEVPDTLDARMIADARAALDEREKMQLAYNVRNTHRAVGTRLSSEITRRFGMKGLAPGHITVRLRGSAGQSLGAFAVQGLKLEVFGDANDYVGKGLSGGSIVIRPPASSERQSQHNTIIGNTVLYGATAGQLFAAGQAGERFAVRNSGADVVVEGCGSNGCEYMTGGTAVILGGVGANFGAGMTGGMAFVIDPDNLLPGYINADSVIHQRLASAYWESVVNSLVALHARETQSAYAARILREWDLQVGHVWQVCPKEMIERLAHPLDDGQSRKTA